ncbi:MAG: hypothetical protein A2315_07810 [Ignavibacteria bacterium RIFOXYB2_FULL_35_12]|nr:MAG: hypothetical protein A2058_04860 [Ignavibacteria bacterium GWA2_36_19]OGU53038.1 MAG: hypothetical protein A2006_08600 [Ignavibacteria bacterium GWC2_35_8]OGU62182.1 MAG: hypothetical protein A2X60_03995 [Ignavibacteria bacterium GWF2_35_20]OGU82219.1 MAG: hypothetical protein A2254_07055 [Ignavibacteria bacterium RIFOXYA2_FULL_35_9]OGU84588.1 MAG: hypothetical protein A3K31_09125 [Ignavibacteria bacterium RIFOXYA12_FULL_35_25]OGU96858.1 MAG: hypothetical protein A2347_14490 [Ignavibac
MKKSIYKKIAAIIAIIFSLLTIVEGSQVLLGITQPEFIVLTPLLIYNVIMGIIGLLVSGTIWLNHKKVMTYIKIVLIAHLSVLIIVGGIYMLSNAVALHSVQAMATRVIVWLVIVLIVRFTNRLEKQIKESNPYEK